MKILFLGGNHPRHLYIANRIAEQFGLGAAILELREMMIPQPPRGISKPDENNFIKHFRNRDAAENRYFGNQNLPDCEIFEATQETVSNINTADYVKSLKADIAIICGTGLIKEPLYSALPRKTINLHLGLSPKYRGAATLFWPFYFLEPTFTGSTFHYIVSEPDAGEIIHQTTPVLEKSDGVHDVACKTVIQSGDDLLQLLELVKKEKQWRTFSQKGTGKNFLSSDFRPEHLRVIYNLFNDDIVRRYLDGDLKCMIPKLYRQFE
jgi:methionyl-tRNA formyltransferase